MSQKTVSADAPQALRQLLLPAVRGSAPAAGAPAVPELHDLLIRRLDRVLGRAMPCRGIVHLACPGCDSRRRLHFRCEGGCVLCPARAHRRASALARALPRVPVRHWSLSLPVELRGRLQTDSGLTRAVTRAFVRGIFDVVRREMARASGCDASELRCGGAAMVHRAGAALNPNLHVHAVVLDGAYRLHPEAERAPRRSFLSLQDDLPEAALERVAATVRARMDALLDAPVGPRAPRRVDRPTIERAVDVPPSRAQRRRPGHRGTRDGVEVHAAPPVDGDDRAGLFRLSRYVTRPAFDPAKVTITEGGNVRVPLGRRAESGLNHVDLRPEELAMRLGALVPDGPTHRVSYHGVLAPRAADRWRVVPTQLTLVDGGPRQSAKRARPEPGAPEPPKASPDATQPVQLDDALECTCGERMQIVGVEEASDR